jgi:hypothetical protein
MKKKRKIKATFQKACGVFGVTVLVRKLVLNWESFQGWGELWVEGCNSFLGRRREKGEWMFDDDFGGFRFRDEFLKKVWGRIFSGNFEKWKLQRSSISSFNVFFAFASCTFLEKLQSISSFTSTTTSSIHQSAQPKLSLTHLSAFQRHQRIHDEICFYHDSSKQKTKTVRKICFWKISSREKKHRSLVRQKRRKFSCKFRSTEKTSQLLSLARTAFACS